MVKFEYPPFTLVEKSNALFIKHPGAVVILITDNDNRIGMVRQYRPVIDKLTLELPAGKIEKGEDVYAAAKREAIEETGYDVSKLQLLTQFQPDNSITDEVLYIFTGKKSEKVGQNLDFDEFIEPLFLSLEDLVQEVRSGKLQDMKTIITLGLACYKKLLTFGAVSEIKPLQATVRLVSAMINDKIVIPPNFHSMMLVHPDSSRSTCYYIEVKSVDYSFSFKDNVLSIKKGQLGDFISSVAPSAALSDKKINFYYSSFPLKDCKQYTFDEVILEKDGIKLTAMCLYLLMTLVCVAS